MPYEAFVDVDEEFVRSGPGPKYYPTGKLSRGDKVTVHRHDPGGWYMIAPPPGSFSWIQSEYVQRMADGRGRLIANNIIVHVGSSLADERSVYQRTLSKGDVVEILDEATIDGERGPVSLYKVKPPSKEYRWIAGKALVPSDGNRAKSLPKFRPNVQPAPSINGPVAIDLEPREEAFAPSPFQSEPSPASPQPLKTGEPLLKEATLETSLESQRDKLHDLDNQFRAMIQQDPGTWDLASVEQSYQALDQASKDESIHKSVEQRLRSVAKYAKVQQDYAEFHHLTAEAKQRDAQLASMQKQFEQGNIPATSNSTPQPEPALPQTTPALTAPQPAASTRPPGAKFDGAGMIERVKSPPPGAPQFALVTPEGKHLTYLVPPPGLDLNRYVRQSMGLYGDRSYRADLKSELLIIRGMQPVRLQSR